MTHKLTLPNDFQKIIKDLLGTEYNSFFDSLHAPSPASIRINPNKNYSSESDDAIPWTRFGKYLSSRPIYTLDPWLHAGGYYVQEPSSMFLEQAIASTVDLSRPIVALDLCAAPGGKSTHLLSLLNTESLLVSNEAIKSRASILAENIQKWGHANVMVTNNDPASFTRLEGLFDLIVVDAPCSGEGLFRKESLAIHEWSTGNVELCALRQRRILKDIWPALKQNGILIYCTCTYNNAEDEETMNWLNSQGNAEFLPIPIQSAWGVVESKSKNVIGYRFYPHRLKGEGFFISVLKKIEPQTAIRVFTKSPLGKLQKDEKPIANWLTNPEEFSFFNNNGIIGCVPASNSDLIGFFAQKLNARLVGTPMATNKRGKLVPEHASALSIHLKKDEFYSMELNLEQALNYLRKDPININTTEKGFGLASYQGASLGWLNFISNRINNMYPPNWRIRMRS